ncbi:MAG: ABC transporter ATP-binding protein [Desulfobacter sp.]|uniref:ABC transporter ATP-binding protein n=1 Tax=uncultured Desulfobacter sp. TaxID=240139 RepID=UPI0029C7221E|nr:ATP-binding cassette domain-containing protein [uncultured Desulfobacter sp.]MCW8800907.1 ABC transporter ATP-binding protein [Desulfobacter sp.]
MIDVQNLTKYYGDFCAVDDISLTIEPGRILGLLGPNGAGKTTTLRMLTGFYTPTSGTIRINDLKMPEDTLKIKSMIGYLPESAPLYHNMLVYDYLDYVARLKGMDDPERRLSRFRELSRLCGLSGIMAKPIGNLSKGLRQRVGLAHAMMSDPDILILDEPTSGLDPNQIAEIRDIIKGIGREKTIIFSTHILSEAEATCDRIAIINKGKKVADDSTERLKQNARHRSLIRLTVQNAEITAALDHLKAFDASLDITVTDTPASEGISFELCCKDDKDIRRDLYLSIKKTDWIITELARQSLALEEIFQELTREGA